MVQRFFLAVVLFHVAMIAVSLGIGRRWARRAALPAGARDWTLALARDAALFLLAALVAALCPVFAPRPGFTTMRLLCQALFGEAVLLAAWIAGLHLWSRQRLRALLPAAVGLALLAVYWEAYHREPHDLQLRHHLADLSGGAPQPRTLRILHLTDIQTPEVSAYEEGALRRGLAQRPDLVVFTGDYVQQRIGAATGPKAAADFRAMLRRVGLAAPLGVYATEGDAGFGCRTIFQGLDVSCLVDDSRRIELPGGRSLALVGLATRTSRRGPPKRLLQVIEAAPAADLRIVIGHAPDFVATLAGRTKVDLALAGHTHGGQVVLPFFGPPLTLTRLPREYAGGLHEYRGIPLHVSRGVGMERGTAPQIRFLCPPEICVLDVSYRGTGTAAAGQPPAPG